eukprot:CAMPEP_0176209016 /NCGR_PEP_ID=MMETSP0121_2-20121125/13420_1 /TAXON_ID=160619 /ORGANISM="Kryptoperidinium foliaceum, Strain CCMP 1326" /LENGTH=243 /DNA_ID=CAMNT_0017548023 /DNA_START=123 /DNA_END=852 /DNA_ORIENTATION=-
MSRTLKGRKEAGREGHQEDVAQGVAPPSQLLVAREAERHAAEHDHRPREQDPIDGEHREQVAQKAARAAAAALKSRVAPSQCPRRADRVEQRHRQEPGVRGGGGERHEGAADVDEDQVQLQEEVVLHRVDKPMAQGAVRVVAEAERKVDDDGRCEESVCGGRALRGADQRVNAMHASGTIVNALNTSCVGLMRWAAPSPARPPPPPRAAGAQPGSSRAPSAPCGHLRRFSIAGPRRGGGRRAG